MPNVYRITLKQGWIYGEKTLQTLKDKYGIYPIQAGTIELDDPRTVEINGKTIDFPRTESEHYVRFFNPGGYRDSDAIKACFRKNGNRGVKSIVNEREGHEYSAGTIGDVQAKKDRKALFFREPESFAYMES
jgi:hypothetical protein